MKLICNHIVEGTTIRMKSDWLGPVPQGRRRKHVLPPTEIVIIKSVFLNIWLISFLLLYYFYCIICRQSSFLKIENVYFRIVNVYYLRVKLSWFFYCINFFVLNVCIIIFPSQIAAIIVRAVLRLKFIHTNLFTFYKNCESKFFP